MDINDLKLSANDRLTLELRLACAETITLTRREFEDLLFDAREAEQLQKLYYDCPSQEEFDEMQQKLEDEETKSSGYYEEIQKLNKHIESLPDTKRFIKFLKETITRLEKI